MIGSLPAVSDVKRVKKNVDVDSKICEAHKLGSDQFRDVLASTH